MSIKLELRKYLMLMAILAATATFLTGLNPPGGVSLRTAFVASVLVILLLLFMERSIGRSSKLRVLAALHVVMVLDFFAVLVAYASGSSRGAPTTVPASLLFFAVSVYITVYAAYRALFRPRPPDQSPSDAALNLRLQRRRKILMLFCIFASTVAYTAGLSPPGSFWPYGQEGYRPRSPVLEDRHHPWRSIAFFVCNTVAFIASLRGIMLLTTIRSKFKHGDGNGRWLYVDLYGHVVVALSGLFVAYAFSNVYIFGQVFLFGLGILASLVCLVGLVCLFGLLFPALAYTAIKFIIQRYWQCMLVYLADKVKRSLRSDCTSLSLRLRSCWSNRFSSRTDPDEQNVGQEKHDHGTETPEIKRPNTAAVLLVTLAATITYQASMNPPGGFWQVSRDVHAGGDSIFLTTHAKRYKVFFTFNSLALVISSVVIPMVLARHASSAIHRHHVLEAVMNLDLPSIVVAYAVGCGRDVNTSVRVTALGGGILVCVVIHIVFFTLKSTRETPELLKKKRKLLLLFAILVVTITYQAGLTPWGGFGVEDDAGGYAVLAKTHPHRYSAFFCCNAASFMSSVAIITLLVKPHVYELGIMCHALYLCAVSALFGLIGPYVGRSSRRVRTSLYVVRRVGLGLLLLLPWVFVFIVVLLLALNLLSRCWIFYRGSSELPQRQGEGGKDRLPQKEEAQPQPHQEEAQPQSQRQEGGGDDGETAKYTTRNYLMLMSILVASVTYQAAGLIPPGGV